MEKRSWAWSGYFTTKLGEIDNFEHILCGICGAKLEVERNNPPADWPGPSDTYDYFKCVNLAKKWHDKARKIIIFEVEKTQSPSLKKIMIDDVVKILEAHGSDKDFIKWFREIYLKSE